MLPPGARLSKGFPGWPRVTTVRSGRSSPRAATRPDVRIRCRPDGLPGWRSLPATHHPPPRQNQFHRQPARNAVLKPQQAAGSRDKASADLGQPEKRRLGREDDVSRQGQLEPAAGEPVAASLQFIPVELASAASATDATTAPGPSEIHIALTRGGTQFCVRWPRDAGYLVRHLAGRPGRHVVAGMIRIDALWLTTLCVGCTGCNAPTHHERASAVCRLAGGSFRWLNGSQGRSQRATHRPESAPISSHCTRLARPVAITNWDLSAESCAISSAVTSGNAGPATCGAPIEEGDRKHQRARHSPCSAAKDGKRDSGSRQQHGDEPPSLSRRQGR